MIFVDFGLVVLVLVELSFEAALEVVDLDVAFSLVDFNTVVVVELISLVIGSDDFDAAVLDSVDSL